MDSRKNGKSDKSKLFRAKRYSCRFYLFIKWAVQNSAIPHPMIIPPMATLEEI